MILGSQGWRNSISTVTSLGKGRTKDAKMLKAPLTVPTKLTLQATFKNGSKTRMILPKPTAALVITSAKESPEISVRLNSSQITTLTSKKLSMLRSTEYLGE